MAYLDWDHAENERINRSVAEQLGNRPFTGYRGNQYIWDAAAEDIAEQELLHRHNLCHRR